MASEQPTYPDFGVPPVPMPPGRREEGTEGLSGAPVGHFFGTTNATSAEGKTIKVSPQVGQAQRPQMQATEAPGWFGNDAGTDVFSSITSSQHGLENGGQIYPSTAYPAAQQATPQFATPSQPAMATGRMQPSPSGFPGFSYEEAGFIGDETFEQLSMSGSISAFGDVTPGSIICHRCNRPNDQQSTFCSRCGFQLVKSPPSQPPQAAPFNFPTRPSIANVVPLTRTGTLDSMVSGQFNQTESSFAIPPSASVTASSLNIGRPPYSGAPLVSHAFPPPVQNAPPTSFKNFPPLQQQPFVPVMPQAAPEVVASPKKEQRIYPAFCFGFGGQLFVSFPMKQMRFAATSTGQMGTARYCPSVMYRSSLSRLPSVQERFIDPVLSIMKGVPLTEKYVKAKDVIQYLTVACSDGATPGRDGREVFYRVLELMLTNKGGIGDAEDEALRKVFLTDSAIERSDMTSPVSPPHAPTCSPNFVAELTRLLIRGDRGNAVHLAVTNQMWSHALLIASHVDRETYCAVVSEFARATLPIGHALRSMYLLFAGQSALVGTIAVESFLL